MKDLNLFSDEQLATSHEDLTREIAALERLLAQPQTRVSRNWKRGELADKRKLIHAIQQEIAARKPRKRPRAKAHG